MTPFRTACAVLAILGALVSPTAVAEGITGRLILNDGPASGVTISAVPFERPQEEARREARKLPGPSAAASTKSGADGTFSLDLPAAPAGREYRLRVEGGGLIRGFVPGAYDPGEKIDLGDLFVDKGEPLSGRVLLPEGVPATQVEVILSPHAGSTPSPEPAPVTMYPAADGRFSFDAAHPTANSLVVRADGFVAAPLSRQKAGPVEKIIRLQSVAPLTGVVRKKDGITLAPGALVRVEGDTSSRWTETDDSGSFRITSSSASARRLVADGGSDGVAEIVLRRGARAGAVLTLGPAASVKGRVIDKATGKSLPRVRLTVEVAGRLSLARSRADGTFEILGLLPGEYAVASDDPRYVPARRGPFSVVAGATLKVDIALVVGASISGRVVDEMGEPLAQAKGLLVPATLAGLRSLTGGNQHPFATGKDGSFRASRLEPGENLRLVVRHPEFEDGAIGSLSLAPGAVRNSLHVVLRRALSAAGIVRDEKGEPVASADIWLAPDSISTGGGGPLPYLVRLTRRPSQRTTTGADGRFEVRGLAPGKYNAGAIKAGYSLSAQTPLAIVRGESPKQLELVLLPGAAISGIVRYADGIPASNRIVAASIKGSGPDSSGWGMSPPTGPDGLFTVPSLRVGALYDLDIFEGRLPGAPKVRAVPSPSDGIEIVLPTPGQIAGVVADSGSREPVADFQVWFDRDRSSSQGRSPALFNSGTGQREPRGAGFSDRLVVHAEDGAFLLDEVPQGTWEVNVEAKGYQPSRIGGVVVAEGQAQSGLRVSLTRGAILRGSVVDARNDRSVSDARIGISSGGGGTGAGPGSLSREAASRGTDAEGLFEVEGLAPGKYTVTAGHPDFSSASQSVEVGENGASVKLSLPSGNRVSGQVLDENRRPVAGAAVGLTTGAAGAGSGFGGGNDQGTLADESGRFRFDHLPAGRYSAIASRQQELTKSVPVVVLDGQPREDVTLVFSPGTVVRGTVTGLPPADLPRVSVHYRGPSGLAGFAKLGADGRFEIANVPDGSLNVSAGLSAGSGNSRNMSKDLVIAGGQTEVEVELAFVPGGAISGTVTQGGRPVPAAFVVASPRGGAGARNFGTGTTADDGTFRVGDLPKGTYGVTARATQYEGIGTQKTVELDGDAVVDLELPTRKVSGVVVEAGSGVPLVDAYVTAAPVAPMVSSSRGASADSTGAFSIEGLDAAIWTVTASKRGFVFQKRTASLSAADAIELRFEGMRADSIGLHAIDGLLGIPLHALFVRARRADGTTAFQGNVTLDSDGRGEVPSLNPGSYSIDVRGGGYSPALLASVTVPSPPLDVRLTPGGTLEIRAGSKALEKGTAKGRIVASRGEAYPVDPYTEDGRVTISGPLVRFSHVTPGSYTLTVDGGEPQAFRIAEGGFAVVALP